MKPSRKPVPKEHAVRDLLAGPCGLDAGSAARERCGRQPPVAAVAEGRSLRVTECFTLFASEPAGRAAEPPQERDDSRETENRPGGGGPRTCSGVQGGGAGGAAGEGAEAAPGGRSSGAGSSCPSPGQTPAAGQGPELCQPLVGFRSAGSPRTGIPCCPTGLTHTE